MQPRTQHEDATKLQTARAKYDVIVLPIEGVAYDLNNRGLAVGHRISDDGTMQAVVISNAGVTALGTLGGSASSARGINDDGVVVGGSLTADDEAHHAFICEAHEIRDLNQQITRDSGWELIQAFSINERGEITAIGHRDGIDHVVVLRPRDNSEEEGL